MFLLSTYNFRCRLHSVLRRYNVWYEVCSLTYITIVRYYDDKTRQRISRPGFTTQNKEPD